ncbi:MAG: phosphohistidine phosphatase SixA [Bacteroidia bacterium]
MLKTLILARHAKSDWPTGASDLQRPLKDRGVQDAAFLADMLAAQGLRPDLIFASPARRARDTADIFARALSYPSGIRIEEDIYHGDARATLEVVHRLPDQVDTVMLFGHNPTLEELASTLHGGDLVLPTCGMVCLEAVVGSWQRFSSPATALRWLLVPRLVRRGDED